MLSVAIRLRNDFRLPLAHINESGVSRPSGCLQDALSTAWKRLLQPDAAAYGKTHDAGCALFSGPFQADLFNPPSAMSKSNRRT